MLVGAALPCFRRLLRDLRGRLVRGRRACQSGPRTLGAWRFQNLADVWLAGADFPALATTFRALGVSPGAHGSAIFRAAPEASRRDAIMAR